jgi:flavin reductase (DIM6/NTAB) family NADH-FMN oxidoreductase RutF
MVGSPRRRYADVNPAEVEAADAGSERLRDTFRAAMSRLPAGVCVVAAALRSGATTTDHAMTATSLVGLSLDPPLVLFTVYSDARLRDALDDTGTWAVSVLDAAAGPSADWLASPGRPTVGQLDTVPHRRGAISGAALLNEAQAWLECRTAWIKPAGDHDVVVGEVLRAALAPPGRGALLHRLGRLAPLPD